MSNSIEKLYIFDGFSEDIIAYFLLMTQEQKRKAGEVIMGQGDISNGCAYYIHKGSVEVSRNDKVINTIHAGGFFGEIALITDERRTATVRAREDCVLQVFLKEDFLTILMQSPHGKKMQEEIRKRILSQVL